MESEKMNPKIKIIAAIAMLVGLSVSFRSLAGPAAGTTSQGLALSVSERIDAAIRASLIRSFSLPEVAQGAPAYSLDNVTGGAAEFSVSGEPDYTFTASVPNVVLLNGTTYNNSSQLAVSSIATADVNAPTTPASIFTFDDTGAATLLVLGSRQSIPSTFSPDFYTGTVTVTVAYY